MPDSGAQGQRELLGDVPVTLEAVSERHYRHYFTDGEPDHQDAWMTCLRSSISKRGSLGSAQLCVTLNIFLFPLHQFVRLGLHCRKQNAIKQTKKENTFSASRFLGESC